VNFASGSQAIDSATADAAAAVLQLVYLNFKELAMEQENRERCHNDMNRFFLRAGEAAEAAFFTIGGLRIAGRHSTLPELSCGGV
jgi:hypothetical protein